MSKLDDIIEAPLTEGEVVSYALGNKNHIHGRMKDQIKTLMLELIGDDEDYPTGDEIVELNLNMTQEMYRIDAQNKLKSRLREKVKEL